MLRFNKKTVCIALCAFAFTFCLAGCKSTQTSESSHPTAEAFIPTAAATAPAETADPRQSVEDLAVVVTEGDIYTLKNYPNLKTLDLSGSTCYAAILDYIAEHPQIAVTYTVPLGGTDVANSETAITLNPGDFDFAALMENLAYLPQLTSISLPDIRLSAEEVSALREAYPDIALKYTVNLFDDPYDIDTTYLDLSFMTSTQLEEITDRLGLLTNLTEVKLSNSLTMEDVAKLQDVNPGALFLYSFNLFGKTLSTADTSVEYKNQNIGNDSEEKIRQALAILDRCERFVLDNCKIDNDVLAGIREDFRDGPKLVWRIYFGTNSRYNALTDADTIRAVYNVTDETCGALRYCEDVKYMDIGHNESLTDLSFVGYMPNIEVLIASGCAVKTLEGFDNCKKLTWLELAYCAKLTDIEALAGCESLTYLNLSFTGVSNYMALDGCPLQRFVCLSPKAATAEQNTFVEIHPKPDCITVYYGYTNPYGYGWRYDDNGKTFNEYYKNVVRVAFNYDYLEQFLPKEE